MPEIESSLPERVAVLEANVKNLTGSVNALAELRDKVYTIEGKVQEKERQESLFWAKYGLYTTILAAVLGVLAALAWAGRL